MQNYLIAALLISLSTAAFAVSPLEGPLTKEGFRHLNGGQIRKAFVGKKFTDDVHFGYHYKANGTIEGTGMGRKRTNTFSISTDRLCVTDSVGEICYSVWKKGQEVRLLVGDSDLSLDGFLR